MPNRTYVKAKLLISKDNNANPQRVSYNSGDVEKIDSITYSEDCSKYLKLAPSTVDQQVSLDTITTAEVLCLVPRTDGVSVKLVCAGQVLADALPMPLKKDYPLIIASSVIGVYLSNSSTADSAEIELGAAGN